MSLLFTKKKKMFKPKPVNELAFWHCRSHRSEVNRMGILNGFLVKCLKQVLWLTQAQDIFTLYSTT